MTIPSEKLPELFREAGLALVDNESIPADLRKAGWMADIYQKEVSDGTLVLQIIYGPVEGKGQVCRRRDVLHALPDGSVRLIREKCEHGDPCQEFYEALGPKG